MSNNQESPFVHLQQSDYAILTPSVAKVLDPGQYPSLKNVLSNPFINSHLEFRDKADKYRLGLLYR